MGYSSSPRTRLDNDGVRDYQVKTVRAIELEPFVKDRQKEFRGEGEPP